MKKQIKRLNDFIMGTRPNNTIFSFNYHNISHVVKYLKAFKNQVKTSDNVILDVGCGASPYYELFEDITTKYIAVDMKESLPVTETRNIIQKIGFAEELPIESESVDIVLSNQVLEHVLDEREAVKESFRVLKKGGYFVGSVPHISPIHLEPYDFRRFTALGLEKLFQDNNFEIIDINGNGSVYKALALTMTMDWFLSSYEKDQSQRFHTAKHLALFWLTGWINILALLGDKIFGDKKRSPSNYCWIARKN